MPIYEYACRKCGEITEKYRLVKDRDEAPECEICGGMTRKILSISRPHSDLDPYYDDNLESHIKSKQHRKQVMKEKGVSEKFGKGWR